MNWNDLLFRIFPYLAAALFVVGTFYRLRYRPFTVSSLSSQLLERRKLFWGSVSFHWGLTLILLAHLAALAVPGTFEAWNSKPVRLYALEATGLALGLWALVGLAILSYRRLSSGRVRAVTTAMDLVVLGLLGAQVLSGVLVAASYRFGSYWGTGVLVPYVRSLLTLDPQPGLMADLPWLVQGHAALFFVFLAVFPFSRLVHIVTLPLGYLFRPWQIVIWPGKRPTPGSPS